MPAGMALSRDLPIVRCGARDPGEAYVCAGAGQGALHRAPFCQRCGRPYQGDITTGLECRTAARWNGIPVGALGRCGARPGARGDSPLQVSAALWFEPFLADLLIRAAGPAIAGAQVIGAGPVVSHQGARARIQPSRTPGQATGAPQPASRNKRCCDASYHRTQTQLPEERLGTSGMPLRCGRANG